MHNIKLIIKNFKEKAPGASNITKTILENIPNEMFDVLKNILNLSTSIGYFPDGYKIAIMNLIGKSRKDLTQTISYRPI